LQRVLQLGNDDQILHLRHQILGRPGLEFRSVAARPEFAAEVASHAFEVLILDWTITQAERQALAASMKATCPQCVVLVFHRSADVRGEVDLACDTRDGFGKVFEVFEAALKLAAVRTHGHAELENGHVMIADENRRYTYVSDKACAALGYAKSELLRMTVDEVTYPGTAPTAEMFAQFMREGSMEGAYVLQKSGGQKLPIHFKARVLPDGCLLSEWVPQG